MTYTYACAQLCTVDCLSIPNTPPLTDSAWSGMRRAHSFRLCSPLGVDFVQQNFCCKNQLAKPAVSVPDNVVAEQLYNTIVAVM